MPLLTDVLLDLFNRQLAQTIMEQLFDFANSKLDGMDAVSAIFEDAALRLDERWIGGVSVIDRQFLVSTNGAACRFDVQTRHCADDNTFAEKERCKFMLNTDITYEIGAGVFSGLLSYLWDLNGTELAARLGVSYINASVARVAKSGIVVNISYNKDGTQNRIQAIAALRTRLNPWPGSSQAVAMFALSLQNAVDTGSASQEEARDILQKLNPILEYYAFTALTAHALDLENATVVFCDENWVFVGANVIDVNSG